MLQDERERGHKEHACYIRQWLDTPWLDVCTRFLEIEDANGGQLPNVPYSYAYHTTMLAFRRGDTSINATRRLELREYLLRAEGVDFEPCIYRQTV